MNRISWMIMAIIEIILFIMLAKSIYGETVKIEKNKLIFFSILVIVCFIIENIFQIHIAYFLILIAVILFSNAKMSKRILNALTVLIIGMGIQEFVTLALTSYSLTVFDTTIKTGDVFYFITMFVVSKVLQYLRETVGINWSEIPSYIYINTVLGFSAGIFPLDLTRVLKLRIPEKYKLLINVVSYFAIVCTIFSIYLYVKNYQEKNKYSQESQEKGELIKAQTKYFENTLKNYEYLKSFRHDIKGHLRALKTLCADNPEAIRYIEDMGNIINESKVFSCSNSTVSAILNAFGNDLKAYDIKYKFHYFVNGKNNVNDLELCSLLYNLTNNAFEAEKKVNADEKCIEVEIISHKKQLFIRVINDVDNKFKMSNIKNKKTTKLDKANHGIGLRNIDEIVNRYKGDIAYSLKNGRIRAEVILHNVVDMDKSNLINEG